MGTHTNISDMLLEAAKASPNNTIYLDVLVDQFSSEYPTVYDCRSAIMAALARQVRRGALFKTGRQSYSLAQAPAQKEIPPTRPPSTQAQILALLSTAETPLSAFDIEAQLCKNLCSNSQAAINTALAQLLANSQVVKVKTGFRLANTQLEAAHGILEVDIALASAQLSEVIKQQSQDQDELAKLQERIDSRAQQISEMKRRLSTALLPT